MNQFKSIWRSKTAAGVATTLVGLGLPALLHAAKLEGVVAPADVVDPASQIVAAAGALFSL